MRNNNDPFEGIFDDLYYKSLPTDEQKERMLNYILRENSLHDSTLWEKAGRWFAVYPWRFAFGIAVAQSVICTLIFGTAYTNLFLNLIGG
jgi:hypothetical protein